MKGVTSLFLLQNVMSICSWSLDNVCEADDIKCQNTQISNPGEIVYGQCYRHAALRRLLKVSFLTCLKECMKTSNCVNVSYRRGWKMCDINGNVKSEVELVQEHGCFSSNISSWSKTLVGKCANHSCKDGYICVLKGDVITCELAYCIGRPSVANALLNEPFGLSRDHGHGMMYKCANGLKLSGKPFAVCHKTGIWKSMFICEKSCEKGWIKFGDHCYYIGPDEKTWDDSKADCIRKGSYLVKIEDASENRWLQTVMTDNNIGKLWICAHDIGIEGTWCWIYDNTTVNFTNWGVGEPNNHEGNENCAELSEAALYGWNDGVCTSVLQYICERQIQA
ncbi:MRC [Mytilus coruscus]|uniref:MRC n=1 Tax=Mytilus coruscus TaxID=42192 RepID=A0A6J8CUY5_MYTCO|nr:MRC [Mytilus coruscus]